MDSSSEDSALLCQPLFESLYRFRYYCKKREMATSTYIFDVHPPLGQLAPLVDLFLTLIRPSKFACSIFCGLVFSAVSFS